MEEVEDRNLKNKFHLFSRFFRSTNCFLCQITIKKKVEDTISQDSFTSVLDASCEVASSTLVLVLSKVFPGKMLSEMHYIGYDIN